MRVAGSMVIPTDSIAVTPKIGSTLAGPKTTRPAVTSPHEPDFGKAKLIFFHFSIREFIRGLAGRTNTNLVQLFGRRE